MADIDLNAPVAAAQQMRQNTQGFLAGQNNLTGDFLSRYTGALGSQEKTGALASRIGSELGLPQLQTNANMLRDTLTNLPGTYSKATTGFDVNANQLQRVITQKAGELAPAVETSERALNNAQTNLNTRLGYETRDQDRALKPFEVEQSFLSDRLARETSLYSQDNQRELDAIIAKLNSGVQLSEGEKNRAQQLALAEKGYQNELEKIKKSAEYNKASQDRYITLGDGATLYDTLTGKVVSENSKNFSGGAGETFS